MRVPAGDTTNPGSLGRGTGEDLSPMVNLVSSMLDGDRIEPLVGETASLEVEGTELLGSDASGGNLGVVAVAPTGGAAWNMLGRETLPKGVSVRPVPSPVGMGV